MLEEFLKCTDFLLSNQVMQTVFGKFGGCEDPERVPSMFLPALLAEKVGYPTSIN